MTTLTKLQEHIDTLIPQVETMLCNQQLDEYQARAITYLNERLMEMRNQAKNGVLERSADRKGEVARVVAEFDPHILTPALGGALMAVESEYYNA